MFLLLYMNTQLKYLRGQVCFFIPHSRGLIQLFLLKLWFKQWSGRMLYTTAPTHLEKLPNWPHLHSLEKSSLLPEIFWVEQRMCTTVCFGRVANQGPPTRWMQSSCIHCWSVVLTEVCHNGHDDVIMVVGGGGGGGGGSSHLMRSPYDIFYLPFFHGNIPLRIPSQKASYAELWCLLCCWPGQAVEQPVGVPTTLI